MQINDRGTFYIEGEYKAGEIILTAGDWELVADVDGYKKYAFGYEPDDFPELVTNGTFDTDISGWSAVNPQIGATFTSVGGEGVVDTGSATFAGASQQLLSTTAGFKYSISGHIDNTSATFAMIRVNNIDVNGALLADSPEINTGLSDNVTFTFVAASSTTHIYLRVRSGDASPRLAKFDNISVKLAHPKAGDNIQLGNGHHKDFRYYPYKLSATDIQELTR